MQMNNVQKIIKEICDEKNIDFKLVSKDWIMVLKKENKVRCIVGYKFPLNNQVVGKICDDKYALYEIAKELKIPIVEHNIAFKKYNIDSLCDYCEQYNWNMVIKNNTGTCGNDMYHVSSKEEFFQRLDEILNKNYSACISPYYDIKTEYRSILLNGKAELVYGKKKPIVLGDGKRTIYELLCEFNENYFSKINPNDELNKILAVGENYEYNWQFNLSKGAMPFLLDNKEKETIIKNMAIDIANKLDLNFASIDIIELQDGSFLLLEINSGVMMDNVSIILENGKELTKNIYSKAIDSMFE